MEQHRDQRYAENRGDGGDKRHLRHQRRTAPKLHAEHGAEGGDGHGNDHRIDLIDKVAHATDLEQKVHRQRHDEEAQKRGNIDFHTAHDLAKGQARHRRSDDHQGGRHGDIAHHRDGTGYEVGSVNTEGYQQGGGKSGNHSRGEQHLGIQIFHPILAFHEHHTGREDEEGIGHIQQGGIENGLGAEDGGDDGIADESHIGKHQREADHPLLITVLGYKPRHPEAEHQQHDVGEETDSQQGQYQRAVGQLRPHHRRENQRGTGDVDHDRGQFLVKLVSHIAQLA